MIKALYKGDYNYVEDEVPEDPLVFHAKVSRPAFTPVALESLRVFLSKADKTSQTFDSSTWGLDLNQRIERSSVQKHFHPSYSRHRDLTSLLV
jgi:hypothetical protein